MISLLVKFGTISIKFSNLIKFNCLVMKLEFHGLDGCGGPLYIGTGCFHRRDILCGRKFSKEYKGDWRSVKDIKREESVLEFEEKLKGLASSTYDKNTQWGKEVSLSPSLSHTHVLIYQ